MLSKTPAIFAAIILVLGFYVGNILSAANPLENDESYTQHQSIQQLGYIDILQGKVDEGNNCPLYYTLSKTFGQIFHFQLQTRWVMEQYVCEATPQLMMRFLPVFFMSLVIAGCFYYFARRYNIISGLIVVGLFLTSPLIWTYWAQDRPYSLWILLTCAHTILLSEYFLFKNNSALFWRCLCVTQWLLTLCSGFGLVQTLLAFVFIRKRFWSVFALPALIGLFYALGAPKYHFRIPTDWTHLILANISWERLVVLIVGIFFARALRPLAAWVGTLLVLGGTLIFTVYLQHTQGLQGFELSPRYLLFLLPSSVIALTLLGIELWRCFARHFWSKLLFIQTLLLILLLGGWRTAIVLHRLL